MKPPLFDPARPLFVVRPFRWTSDPLQVGEPFEWKQLGAHPRQVRVLVEQRYLSHNRPGAPSAAPEKTPPKRRSKTLKLKDAQ